MAEDDGFALSKEWEESVRVPAESKPGRAAEWRITWTKSLTRQVVDRVQTYFSADDFTQERSRLMRVMAGGHVFEFLGENAVAMFCKEKNAALGKARRYVDTVYVKPTPLAEYYLSASLREEVDVGAASTGPTLASLEEAMADRAKRFENIERFRFTSKAGKNKMCVEIVYRSVGEGFEISSTPIMEYEVSAVSPQFNVVMQAASIVYRVVLATPIILKHSDEREVVNGYLDLLGITDRSDSSLEALQANAKKYMINPKPVTLEPRHLVPPRFELTGYAVCDKTDGERSLFYVNGKGQSYLIGSGLRVRATGVSYPDKQLWNSLLDGEFVMTGRDGGALRLFMLFDSYFVGGKDQRREMLMARIQSMAAFVIDQPLLCVRVKEFVGHQGDMREACSALLDRAKMRNGYEYHTDGLIFTPLDLEVSQLTRKVYKWKPPEQNTIDFLVRQESKAAFEHDGKMYMTFTLYTGFNKDRADFGGIKDVLSIVYLPQSRKGAVAGGSTFYVEKEFRPTVYFEPNVYQCNVLVVGGVPVCEDGTPVRSGTIVEFAYHLGRDAIASYNWQPLRCREDKTDEYARTRSISGAANDYTTALSVWRSIHEPVTEGMLRGSEHPESTAAIDADTVYYDNMDDRRLSASMAMLNFHNVIKYDLFESTVERMGGHGRRFALAELGCGKGGDLGKWIKAEFTHVFGVDISRDNLLNGENGAYRRLLEARQPRFRNRDARAPIAFPTNMKVVFAVADVCKNFAGDDAATDESSLILKVVMGLRQPHHSAEAYLSPFHNLGNNNFDVVSCQFAVHYVMSDQNSARTFLRNVSKLLRPGGFFIGTCMDGATVDALFKEGGDVVQGKSASNVVMWELAKQYDTLEPFGSVINVFLERTGRRMPEPLVEWKSFVRLASEYGLDVDKVESFRDIYERRREGLKPMTAEEERFSFLFVTFAFKKTAAAPPAAAQAGGDPAPPPEPVASALAPPTAPLIPAFDQAGEVRTIVVESSSGGEELGLPGPSEAEDPDAVE